MAIKGEIEKSGRRPQNSIRETSETN